MRKNFSQKLFLPGWDTKGGTPMTTDILTELWHDFYAAFCRTRERADHEDD
jgi:hypothetical protein